MNISLKKIGTFFLIIVSIFIFSGCELLTSQATITSIEVDATTLEESYDIDTFDLSSINIKVSFSDDKFQLIPITEAMLSGEHQAQLLIVGQHEITITYEGNTTTLTLNLIAGAASHIISFDSNGGTSVDSITQDYGTSVIAPENPTKEGYTFSGWYTDVDLTNEYPFTTMPAEDITLYAKWSNSTTYNISYELDGGINGSNPLTYTVESSTITLENPAKEGYTFNGWFDNAEYTGDHVAEIVSGNTGDITLYAKWIPNQYTIDFQTNGGSTVEPITQDYLTNIYEPDLPEKEGYQFSGWYSDSNFVDPYTFSTMPSADITLYAKWIVNHYVVTYRVITESIASVITGFDTSFALTTGGDLYSWGNNDCGQLGDGTTNNQYDPINNINLFALEDDEKILLVFPSQRSTMLITDQGRVLTFGLNGTGQLGDGSTNNSLVAIDITNNFGLEDDVIIDGASNYWSAFAISLHHRVFAWGSDVVGQLGDGSKTNQYLPVDITNHFMLNEGEYITKVIAGNMFTFALSSTGRIFAWGYNSQNQLGYDSIEHPALPVDVTAYFNLHEDEKITSISAGGNHALVSTDSNRVFAMGANTFNQIGMDIGSTTINPVDITSIFDLNQGEGIKSITAGKNISYMVTTQNRIFSWGSNSVYVLNPQAINRNELVEITSIFDFLQNEEITYISSVSSHQMAMTSKSRIFIWGLNTSGQLGDGTNISTYTPRIIQDEFDPFDSTIIHTEAYDFLSQVALYVETEEGYQDYSWYFDNEFTDPASDFNMPGNNIDLFSQLVPIDFSLEYVLDGGLNNDLNPQYYDVTQNDIQLYDPEKEGYEFIGWYDDDQFNGDAITTISTDLCSNIELYAKWETNQYTVSFETNLEIVIPEITLDYGTYVNLDYEMNYTGYTFLGWYLDSNFSTPIFDLVLPSHNVALYAKWAINQYTITFNAMGGHNVSPVNINYLAILNPNITTSRTGYTFAGWYLDELYAESYDYEPMPAENLALYAKWDVNSYAVTYYDEHVFSKIVDISQGYNHTISLSASGTVYTMGQNLFGQLGKSSTIIESHDPQMIKSGIKLISAGGYHNIMVDTNNNVYTFGYNNLGQLGDGTITTRFSYVTITSRFGFHVGETVVSVSSTACASYLVTSEGRVFSWGSNQYGQLGANSSITNSLEPMDITSEFVLDPNDKIVEVKALSSHVYAISQYRQIFGWGNNENHVLAPNTSSSTYDSPINITSKFGFVQGEFVQTLDTGGTHSTMLTTNGRVLIWGSNECGQLGIETSSVNTLVDLTNQFDLDEDESILDIQAGDAFTYLITSKNKVFGWGLNESDRLLLDDVEWTYIPTDISSEIGVQSDQFIDDIFVGHSNVFLSVSTTNLYSWGSNDCGELGYGTPNSSSDRALEMHDTYHIDPYLIYVGYQSYEFQSAIPIYNYVYDGFELKSWYYYDNFVMKDLNNALMPARSVNAYAILKLNNITIDYHLDGEVNNWNNHINYTIFDGDINLFEPYKEGYEFAGWYDNDAFEGSPIIKIVITNQKHINLYPLWEESLS